jgi:hypothetical protein
MLDDGSFADIVGFLIKEKKTSALATFTNLAGLLKFYDGRSLFSARNSKERNTLPISTEISRCNSDRRYPNSHSSLFTNALFKLYFNPL